MSPNTWRSCCQGLCDGLCGDREIQAGAGRQGGGAQPEDSMSPSRGSIKQTRACLILPRLRRSRGRDMLLSGHTGTDVAISEANT
jgi:hypothetical protein